MDSCIPLVFLLRGIRDKEYGLCFYKQILCFSIVTHVKLLAYISRMDYQGVLISSLGPLFIPFFLHSLFYFFLHPLLRKLYLCRSIRCPKFCSKALAKRHQAKGDQLSVRGRHPVFLHLLTRVR